MPTVMQLLMRRVPTPTTRPKAASPAQLHHTIPLVKGMATMRAHLLQVHPP